MGLAYSSKGLVYCHHGEEHGGRQADMVLEKVLEGSTLDPQAARRPLGHAWALETQSPPAMRHFLQQAHTY